MSTESTELTVGIIGGGGWLGRSIGSAMLEKGVLPPAALILSSRSGQVNGSPMCLSRPLAS
jgi:pyrroline-5-carboxylate reductase